MAFDFDEGGTLITSKETSVKRGFDFDESGVPVSAKAEKSPGLIDSVIGTLKEVPATYARARDSIVGTAKEVPGTIERMLKPSREDMYARGNADNQQKIAAQARGWTSTDIAKEEQQDIAYKRRSEDAPGAALEVGRQLVGGAVTRLPAMATGALEWWMPQGTKAEKVMQEAKDYWQEAEKGWTPDTEGRGFISSTLIKGASQLAPSLAGMAAAAANPVVGGGLVLGMFGGSQAQETYSKGIKAGLPENEATTAAYLTGMIEGFGELIGDVSGAKFLKGTSETLGKMATEGAVKAATDPRYAAKFAKDWIANAVIQSGTEYAQGASQAAIENKYGISHEDPFAAGAEGAQSALGMSLLLGPLAGKGHYSAAKTRGMVGKALADPNAPKEIKMAASEYVAKDITGMVGKDAADAWKNTYQKTIDQGTDQQHLIESTQQQALAPIEPSPSAPATEVTAPVDQSEQAANADLLAQVQALHPEQAAENIQAAPDVDSAIQAAQQSIQQPTAATPVVAGGLINQIWEINGIQPKRANADVVTSGAEVGSNVLPGGRPVEQAAVSGGAGGGILPAESVELGGGKVEPVRNVEQQSAVDISAIERTAPDSIQVNPAEGDKGKASMRVRSVAMDNGLIVGIDPKTQDVTIRNPGGKEISPLMEQKIRNEINGVEHSPELMAGLKQERDNSLVEHYQIPAYLEDGTARHPLELKRELLSAIDKDVKSASDEHDLAVEDATKAGLNEQQIMAIESRVAQKRQYQGEDDPVKRAAYSRDVANTIRNKINEYSTISRKGQGAARLAEGTEGTRREAAEARPAEAQVTDRRQNQAGRVRVEHMTPEERATALLTSAKTGIPNDRAFNEHVEVHPENIVLYGDLDDFKAINTKYGHTDADQILKAVGAAKAEIAKSFGVNPFHLSGDEFLATHADTATLEAYGKAVQEKLSRLVIPIIRSDGTVVEHEGVGFSYGTGKDKDAAEHQTDFQKEERKRLGLRTGARDVVGVPTETTSGEPNREAVLQGNEKPVEEQFDPFAPKTVEQRLADPDTIQLLDAIRDEAGWAEVGGKIIRNQEGAVTGRTNWIAKADWWAGKPGEVTEKTIGDALKKLKEGTRLTPKDNRVLAFMLAVHDNQEAVRREYSNEELALNGYGKLSPEAQAVADEILAHAETLGEDAVEEIKERLAIQLEDHSPAEFQLAIRDALNEEVNRRSRGGANEETPTGRTGEGNERPVKATGEEVEREELRLESYTREEVAAKEAREADEALAERERIKKQSEGTAGHFTLTGETPVAKAASTDQNKLFSRGVEPTRTEKEITKDRKELQGIFEGMGRSLGKASASAKEAAAAHPKSEIINHIQDNFYDILATLESSGKVEINC